MNSEQVTTRTDVLGRAFASTRAVLAEVQAGQLAAPTPCAAWDVRALINHFVGTARWAAAGGGRSLTSSLSAEPAVELGQKPGPALNSCQLSTPGAWTVCDKGRFG
jgi:uncharacterized protein (TIGR03083 family)